MEFDVRGMKQNEWREWSVMRQALYDGLDDADAEREALKFMSGEDQDLKIVLLAVQDTNVIGFAELSERSVAEGCYDGPVAYLEGWYIKPDFRKKGVGAALIEAAKKTGRHRTTIRTWRRTPN